MIAFTEIRHGKDDGSVLVIKQGETVKGLPDDVAKSLKEQGLIGTPAEVDDTAEVELTKANEELKKQVDALKAELEAAKKPAPSK